jgi:hypothetical protein
MRKLLISLVLLAFIQLACDQQKMPLPVPRTTADTFGANDTSYVELYPAWDQTVVGTPLVAPSDLTMGPDGIIYLANEGADQVLALTKAGQIVPAPGLTGIPHPRGLAIDSKLNLLIVNGHHQIFCWNQYLHFVPIDSVAQTGVYYDQAKRDTVHLTFLQLQAWAASGRTLPSLQYFLFEKNEALADYARGVTTFFQHDNQAVTFNGVTAGKFGSGLIYATDSQLDKIIQLQAVPDLAIKISRRQILFHYRGIYVKEVASYGSGSGTVDDPWAITTDTEENIYFTQLGGNFRTQKLTANTFTPRYVLYQHEIMDLGRFTAPYDLSLDDAGAIFVLDTGAGYVYKFGNAGVRAGQLLSMGRKGLAVTTFKDARGLFARDRIVYVVETGANRIRRFQYSVSDADLPDDGKTP